jgi:hypothetical protein
MKHCVKDCRLADEEGQNREDQREILKEIHFCMGVSVLCVFREEFVE